ncbi:MAG: ABC-F family ATP-binding cassette domain-containing protein [Acidobacteriota bacterium]
MLQLSGAGKRFGQKLLFEDVNWLITPNERTGLVGGNGTGKSTLLKIIGGIEHLDYGQLTRVKGMTIGYLPQDGLLMSGKTVFEECLSVFDELRNMEIEAEQLTHVLSDADPKSKEYAAAADRYSEIADHLHVHDIYTLDAQVGAVLGGLGFTKEDWERKTEEFSGGWQMRIALAKLLLQKPSLLLLDEPTNHLDIESRNWLEEYLNSYENAFILISHDRYFLDVTVKKIVEVWNKRMQVYHGNYEKYLTLKEERRNQIMAAYKNQRDRIEALEAFINRFRAQATKAKQVQSRVKELEKIERIEVPEEEATIHFSFPQPIASGRTVIEVKHLTKHYPMPDGGTKKVLENISFTIERGDRIALVGANGAGKSTMIRMLSDLEKPTSGTVKLGHNVLADYFAQDQYKVLDHSAEMLDDITGSNPKVDVVTLRSLLGCFMFSGDDVFKKLGVLSGGERNRYAMAKMLVSPSNFLLLDEPTNHLDLRAKDVLLDAIRNFSGTVLFVSHDRYFIDGLATKVFEVEDRRLHIYPGNYEDYLFRKSGGLAKIAESARSNPHVDTATGMLKPSKQVGTAEAEKKSAKSPSAAAPSSAPSQNLSSRPEAEHSAAAAERPAAGTTAASLTIASDDWDNDSARDIQGSPAPVTPTPKPHVKRLNPIKLKQLEDRVAQLERELPDLEARIQAASEQQAVFSTAEAAQALAAELEALREQHAVRTAEWEDLALQLEEQTTV